MRYEVALIFVFIVIIIAWLAYQYGQYDANFAADVALRTCDEIKEMGKKPNMNDVWKRYWATVLLEKGCVIW